MRLRHEQGIWLQRLPGEYSPCTVQQRTINLSILTVEDSRDFPLHGEMLPPSSMKVQM